MSACPRTSSRLTSWSLSCLFITTALLLGSLGVAVAQQQLQKPSAGNGHENSIAHPETGINRRLAAETLASPPGSDAADEVEEEEANDEEFQTFQKHGILMCIAFCILMPLAFLCNRIKNAHFLREQPQLTKAFFYLHIFFNVAAVALAAAGFALPFDKQDDLEYSEVSYSHGSFGIAIMAVFFLQALYPWFRPAPTPLTTLRKLWELVHTTLGRAILVMGLVNIALGTYIHKEEHDGSIRFFACLAAVPVCAIAIFVSFVDRLSAQSANSTNSGSVAYLQGVQVEADKPKAVDAH